MGFFDFLFGGGRRTQVENLPDKVWLTIDAKYAGLAKELAERSTSESAAILLVAHFRDVLERLQGIADRCNSSVPTMAVLANNLTNDLAASLEHEESALIDIIGAERHPLASADQRLESFADTLPCRCRVSHHLSLDDPVIEVFAGDWVKDMLGKLGMKEDESIESKMVTRRIRAAQKKIESQAFIADEADSALQWMESNCPELLNK